MKKNILFALSVICFIILFSACNSYNISPGDRNGITATENINQIVKDTPVLFGTKSSKVLVQGYTYTKLIEKADIIAKVKIVEWLCESTESDQTFFKAEILDVLKGNVKNNEFIKIRQEGSSSATIQDFPFFKNNDKLILFLKQDTDHY